MEHQPEPAGTIKLGPENLRTFFIDHLNIIYCAKAHLVARLPEIAVHVHFTDLREGILETVSDVQKQLARVELILTLLDAGITGANCPGISGMIEEAFQGIKRNTGRDHGLRDLSIAYYMQQIESVEMASFQILEMASVKLKDKQIKRLVKENYNEARADRTLMLLIATKYIIAK
jgi:ferritin-like metal-binding protein YciE